LDRTKGMARTAPSSQPIYQRVRDHFVSQIDQGVLCPHSKLPSERTLSETLKISRTTARQAFIQLESEGFIYRSDRRGWFVAPPRLHYNLSGAFSFFSSVITEGGTPGAEVLSKETGTPPRWVRERLGLEPKEKVHKTRRLPGFHDHDMHGSFFDVLAKDYGVHPHHHEISLRLVELDDEDARLLGQKPGSAGVLVTQAVFDADGWPFSIDSLTWRGDIAEFTVSGRVE
jgi:DNA-binding GntR family transcriptional regulator